MAKEPKPTIQIDHNVPMPKVKMRLGDYPFKDLKVGDSFLVTTVTRKALYKASAKAAKLYGAKYTVAEVKGGVRAWRTL